MYFDQVKVDFDQRKKEILFMIEFCYPTYYEASDDNLDAQI